MAADLLPALQRFLDARGLGRVRVEAAGNTVDFRASRQLPDEPWAHWAAGSIEHTLGRAPQVLPNAAGALPHDIFARDLGMVTLWVPHSYNSCGQHAVDEHLSLPVVREGLALMAGLRWDMGEAEGRPCETGAKWGRAKAVAPGAGFR